MQKLSCKIIAGAKPFEAFKNIIDDELKKAESEKKGGF